MTQAMLVLVGAVLRLIFLLQAVMAAMAAQEEEMAEMAAQAAARFRAHTAAEMAETVQVAANIVAAQGKEQRPQSLAILPLHSMLAAALVLAALLAMTAAETRISRMEMQIQVVAVISTALEVVES